MCGVVLITGACLPISQAAAQDTEASENSSPTLPDAPTPLTEAAALDPGGLSAVASGAAAQNGAPTDAANGSPSGAGQSSSSTQSAAQQPSDKQTQREKAAEQIKQQETQRVAGIVPSFNVSYVSNAASMSPGQKMSLAFRSTIDPYAFGLAFVVAGINEADDDDPGFGWGAEGYFKRSGAAYLDAFDGEIIGNGILPVILHQDPRYFRLGYGSAIHRILYSAMTSYMCKHDNTGKWQPNYSNVGGNIIAGAISNLYYPDQNSGWGQTITNGFIVTSEGMVGAEIQEFWPDFSRRFLHRDPTHGLDAQARARYAAQKAAKMQAKKDAREEKKSQQ